jgi:hypothetical protein
VVVVVRCEGGGHKVVVRGKEVSQGWGRVAVVEGGCCQG